MTGRYAIKLCDDYFPPFQKFSASTCACQVRRGIDDGALMFLCHDESADAARSVHEQPQDLPPDRGVRQVTTPALADGGPLGLTFGADAGTGVTRVLAVAAASPLVGLVWPGERVRIIDGEFPDGTPPAALSERLDSLSHEEHLLFVERDDPTGERAMQSDWKEVWVTIGEGDARSGSSGDRSAVRERTQSFVENALKIFDDFAAGGELLDQRQLATALKAVGLPATRTQARNGGLERRGEGGVRV